jgi:hypothetical protein
MDNNENRTISESFTISGAKLHKLKTTGFSIVGEENKKNVVKCYSFLMKSNSIFSKFINIILIGDQMDKHNIRTYTKKIKL